MDKSFPYQTPLSQEPPAMPSAMIFEPPAVKVFGIMHLAFAGVGILTGTWGIFMAIAGNPFIKMSQGAGPMTDSIKSQITMQEKITPFSITSAILSLLVAIPMIIAGIKLLKRRGDGLKWSNTYAFSSLGAKLVNLVMTITILVPAVKEMTQGAMAGSHVPGAVENVMGMVMAGSAVGSVIITCVYPVLALVLLNRPNSKAWFATLGK